MAKQFRHGVEVELVLCFYVVYEIRFGYKYLFINVIWGSSKLKIGCE